jgi:hypothetical protein
MGAYNGFFRRHHRRITSVVTRHVTVRLSQFESLSNFSR